MRIFKSLVRFVEKFELPQWLEVLLGAVFLLRIPSFFEPFTYGDEMIYLTLGNAIKHGLILYKDIHDNKPPLLYLLAAIAGNVFWFKVILAAFSLVAIVFFYKLAKKLLEKEAKVLVATIAFAILTTLPLLECNIANAENFMILFTISALLILFVKKHSPVNLFVAGVLFSIAALFKIPAAFDVPVIMVFWIITTPKENWLKVIKKSAIVALGFVIPIALTFVWYYFKGALPDYIHAAFLQNVGYLSSFRPGDVQKPFIERNGPLLARGGVVLLGVIILWIKSKKLSKEFLFATIWLLFSLFAATLSERPYPHYLLQVVPAASLLIAILVKGQTLDQVLTIIPLGLLLFVPVYYKFYYYPTFSYYTRFVNFATGRMTKDAYLATFGGNTITNYEISDFIVKSTKPTDMIFVWGDSPAIYALTRRVPAFKYVAAYHVLDFSSKEELLKSLKETKPVFVVLLNGAPSFPEITPFLNSNYMLISGGDGSQIWHLIPLKAK